MDEIDHPEVLQMNAMSDTTNYKKTNFGLYIPTYVAEEFDHLDLNIVTYYKSHLRNTGKANATIEKYTRFVEHFVLFLGDRYLSVSQVRTWLESMKENRHINTVNNAISALNGFFKWLGRQDCVVSFFPHQEPQYLEDDRSLEKKDFDRLLHTADTRMKNILLTFFHTGIRVSELQYFTVESVREGCITVNNKGKTRTVFVDPVIKDLLLRYCDRRDIRSGVIFRNCLGNALSRSFIWRSMKKLAKEAGVKLSKVFPHNLRHLFAVERYKADKDIESLRLDLGHSLIATTQRYLKETVGAHFRKLTDLAVNIQLIE